MRYAMIAILCCFAMFVNAADAPPFQTWIGKTAEATHRATLHSSPRSGLFCNGGDDIDSVQLTERIHILGYRKVSCGMFFTFEFLEIERISSGIPPEKRRGFVQAVDDQTPRFRLVPNESQGGQ